VAAPTTVTYGGLNLNDGTTYTLLGGFDPGERMKTWSEYRGYDGTAAQYNVSEANLIEMRVPLLIKSTTNAGLSTAVAAINNIIDGGDATFIWDDGGGAVSYACVHSPRIRYVRDSKAQSAFFTVVDMVLYRTP
jgi:hypothetical protein